MKETLKSPCMYFLLNVRKIDQKFPSSAPQLYVKNAVEHKVVNKQTLVVDYQQFYKWGVNSKIVDILNASEKYFKTDSPFATYENTITPEKSKTRCQRWY